MVHDDVTIYQILTTIYFTTFTDYMADKNKRKISKYKLYKVEGDKLVRKVRNCPRCGPGIFMAKHAERENCGKCGYTEFAKK